MDKREFTTKQEQEFKRYGIDISSQNLSNWIIKGAGMLKPFMLEMKEELLEQTAQSLVEKAITYAQNQKEYLCSFLKDGRIQLSNNLAEQSVKLFVIGRKNWLFANTPNGASASSLIYSVIQTAIANDRKPLSYLEYVFGQIQLTKDLPDRRPVAVVRKYTRML